MGEIAKQSSTSVNNLHNVIITDVLLKNGKITQVVTIFNNRDIDFECVNIGVTKALERSRVATKMKSTFSSYKNKVSDTISEFEETLIKDYRPELDPDLNH